MGERMDQFNSYFTISDLAKELDVKKSHIRFCEENGLLSPRASKLTRRLYNRYDRERLKLVFHFVLLGYSKEQMIDLIGIPDANLDENEQLIQGIDYGIKALKKLEKRKEELSFTKQTRIINEIEMLREYIKKIKIIKSGVFEEPSAKPRIRFEEKAKIPTKPFTSITAEVEKKRTQHPVKVISLFIAGLALVVFIGSYFYYQAGQKETKTIKRVQKKPIHSGEILEPQMSEPVDQTTKVQIVAPEAQEIPKSTSPAQSENVNAQSTDALLDVTQRNGEIQSESDANLLKDEKSVKKQLVAVKTDTVALDDTIQAGKAKETIPSQTSKEISVSTANALVSEKQTLGTPKVEETPKDDIEQEVDAEGLKEKAVPDAPGEDTVIVAVPELVKEKAPDIEVKETPESESTAKASSIRSNLSLVKEKQMFDSLKAEETLKDDVEKEVDAEGLKEKAVPDTVGEDTVMAAAPEPGVEKVGETEVPTPSTGSEKKMGQKTSQEDINRQKNELSRLKSFLDNYCQAYTKKNLDKFITFFTLDATENNTPFHELLPDYRKKMEGMEYLTYRIELMSFSRQIASGNLMIRGRFFTRYQSKKGVWEENNGSIFMELLEKGDSFLIKQLNY
jgi:DNA-binding transcriptional MerR regulator